MADLPGPLHPKQLSSEALRRKKREQMKRCWVGGNETQNIEFIFVLRLEAQKRI